MHKVLDKQKILCYTIYKIKEREVNTMDMIIRFCEIAIIVISIIFLSWVGVSFLEIVTHNIEMESYVLSDWNFFTIWFDV